MAPFSEIVFSVVVWTIVVSGAKQLRFRLKTDKCGRGLRSFPVSGFELRDESMEFHLVLFFCSLPWLLFDP